MTTGREKGEDKASTRDAILEATQKIMLEDGYAAVSSRRVAAVAGLKSQLVYYHFGSMDALFLALFKRTEEAHFSRHLRAMASPNPVRALLESIMATEDSKLVYEFMALASHRKIIAAELIRAAERRRQIEVTFLPRFLEELGISAETLPPVIASVLLSGIVRAIVTENALGFSVGHSETRAFIEKHLDALDRRKTKLAEAKP